MSRWLLDTNVVSEVWKPRPSLKVQGFYQSCPVDDLFLSVVTIAELAYGASTVTDPLRKISLSKWLTRNIRPLFANRVIDITEPVMLRWLALIDTGRMAKRTFSQPDLFLAATALEHELTLVTRNVKDFQGVPGLSLFNPWD